MQLSIHKRYLRTNTQKTIVVNSTPYESHIRRRYSNLEINLLPLTDTVQLPVNGPCKSRYLAKNVICSTVLSFNIQLYHCIPVFPRLYLYNTYLPNTDYTDYTDKRVVFIIWTDNVNAICTTTISSDIQLWYCIAVFHRLHLYNLSLHLVSVSFCYSHQTPSLYFIKCFIFYVWYVYQFFFFCSESSYFLWRGTMYFLSCTSIVWNRGNHSTFVLLCYDKWWTKNKPFL